MSQKKLGEGDLSAGQAVGEPEAPGEGRRAPGSTLDQMVDEARRSGGGRVALDPEPGDPTPLALAPPRATLDDLAAEGADLARLRREHAARAASSTSPDLASIEEGTLKLAPPPPRSSLEPLQRDPEPPDEEQRLPPSTLEPLLQSFTRTLYLLLDQAQRQDLPRLNSLLHSFLGRMSLRGEDGPPPPSLLEAMGHPSGDASERIQLRPDIDPEFPATQLENLLEFSQRLLLRPDPNEDVPPSRLESLLRFTHRIQLRPDPDGVEGVASSLESALAFGGSLFGGPESASEAGELLSSLESALEFTARAREAGAAAGGRSTLEDLLLYAEGREPDAPRRSLREPRSTMADLTAPQPGGPMRLGPDGHRRSLPMADDLSKLLVAPSWPRARLPPRQAPYQPPEPDGFTPIPPARDRIRAQLTAAQRRLKPEPAGELIHERLECRYHRFERLEIRQPLYAHPSAPEPFVGADPAFFCQDAPFGNGMLAQAAASLLVDRMTTAEFTTLLNDLGAPVSASEIWADLRRLGLAAAPVVAAMRAEMGKKAQAETPTPAVTSGADGLARGQVRVLTGAGHVVFEHAPGERRFPPAQAGEGDLGRQLLAAWAGQGKPARWARIRQGFTLALLTDPYRARQGLLLLSRVPPYPEGDEPALEALREWLVRHAATFKAPRNRFEHAVSRALGLWKLLIEPEPPSYRKDPAGSEWRFREDEAGPEATMNLLSLAESCARLGAHPGEYLWRLTEALAADPEIDGEKWTPKAWLGA